MQPSGVEKRLEIYLEVVLHTARVCVPLAFENTHLTIEVRMEQSTIRLEDII